MADNLRHRRMAMAGRCSNLFCRSGQPQIPFTRNETSAPRASPRGLTPNGYARRVAEHTPETKTGTRFARWSLKTGHSVPRRKREKAQGDQLAGGPGFEPRLTESESAVLPLNYPPPKQLMNNGFFGGFLIRGESFANRPVTATTYIGPS